ncbi:hypothetical protein GCM10009846_20390 [Agrococcus versicolor]|uniref:Carboxymuconolactone decarboxylase family protein n=1 Tax=Agrococcus versicolor TaxID=501482 RepID=A0ABP5MIH6_9MICO
MHEQDAGHLGAAPDSEAAAALVAEDVDDLGYVMRLTRVWAHAPELHARWFDAVAAASSAGGLDLRDKGVLVSATASEMGDAYCALAWGARLASAAGDDVAVAVLEGDEGALDDRDRALAAWARRVVRDPSATTADDVAALRTVGLDDRQILAATVYVALRQAFSAVNDALGAAPDLRLAEDAPAVVRDAVRWGRPPA